ncbi:MAG: VWA domain-containing protein [Deltaproteobacteria bacterium]|nr:VWA domain-containing protein [Deltaproteobacteria bacterium]
MKRRFLTIIGLLVIAVVGCGTADMGGGGGADGDGNGGQNGEVQVSKELGVLYRDLGRPPYTWETSPVDGAPAVGPTAVEETTEDFAEMVPNSRLKGGEWNDHEHFAEYLTWAGDFNGELVYWFDADPRIVMMVRDEAGAAVPNARVVLTDVTGASVYQAVTDGQGEAVFFPNMLKGTQDAKELTLAVTKGDARAESRQTIDRAQSARWDLRLATVPRPLAAVDVVFALDTTGSMYDEIGQLRETLQAIVTQTGQLNPSLALRLGLVLFRDRGDEYVTQVTDLTSDVAAIQEQIDGAEANGGGDYRESVSAALHDAVRTVHWSAADAEAARLIFLIGDAPPHLDYAQEPHYLEEALMALRQGIKIYPVAASGIDDAGEYVFRQLSLLTMAKFIFISYNGTAPYAVGAYDENNLDEIIFTTIAEEIATYGVAND